MDIPVLYEDEKFLILNKPAGLPVQGGKGVRVSLDSLLAQNYKERPLLVHRLDKDTSGVIVTAKTKESASLCSVFFSARQKELNKTYIAFCSGILDTKGIISEKLVIKGRELKAETTYKTLANLQELLLPDSGKPADSISLSLAEIKPSTGRMHQIRRHLAQSGHPILGDDKYGNFALNKKIKKALGLKQLFLHAYSIFLPPLLVKGGLEISAPLPDYFLELMEKTGIKYHQFTLV